MKLLVHGILLPIFTKLIIFQIFHGTTGTFLLVFHFIHDILDREFGKILIL